MTASRLRLILIDANSLFYRAYFAIKAQLVTSRGEPTNAVFGFVKMVRRLLDELEPGYLAVCFDVGKVTHRTERFAGYKIHRAPMPEGLLAQVPAIKEVVRAYNFAVLEARGFEADDVIASVVHQVAEAAQKIVIVSSDKDILQLVGGNVEVYNPYSEGGIVFSEALVREKFGVEPRRIPDLISLMGDASDNIPGARGIGAKTAVALLSEFENVEDLVKNMTRVKRPALREILKENLEMIRLSRELATLRRDVPVHVTLENLKVVSPDTQKLWEVFSRLEFKGMLEELSEARLSFLREPTLSVSKEKAADTERLLRRAEEAGGFAFFIEDENKPVVNLATSDAELYETDDVKFLKELFSRPSLTAVGCDLKSSEHVLRRFGVDVKTALFDVLVAASLVESSKSGRGLEGLLWDHLALQGLSRLDYFGKESHFVLKLKGPLEKALCGKELDGLFIDVEMPLLQVLFEMEEAGVSIDRDMFREMAAQAEKKLEKLAGTIYDLSQCSFNINSPKQLSDVLFNKLKLPVLKKTKTGISTDEEVLTKLAREHKLPRLLLEYRQISKLKTTYIDALPQLVNPKTQKIHCIFDQAGTETGRLSCRNPNLQNIPVRTEMGRRIRQAFVPSARYDGILSADYSQVELRILAHLSADEALKKAFEEEGDVHRYTASLIFGVGENDVSEEMRENAKRVNFGIIYGMSSFGLAKDLGLDPVTAQGFIDAYFARYPKVKTYLDAQIEFARKNGYVKTILGRRRYIPEINNPNNAIRQFAERQAVNAPVQGSAADLIKTAMIRIQRRLKEAGLKSRMILQVHDELVFEFVSHEKDVLAGMVRTSMERAVLISVPLKVMLRAGCNWLDTEEMAGAGDEWDAGEEAR